MDSPDHRSTLLALRKMANALLRDIDRAIKGPGKRQPQKGLACNCGSPAQFKGLCRRCYNRAWQRGEVGQHRRMGTW